MNCGGIRCINMSKKGPKMRSNSNLDLSCCAKVCRFWPKIKHQLFFDRDFSFLLCVTATRPIAPKVSLFLPKLIFSNVLMSLVLCDIKYFWCHKAFYVLVVIQRFQSRFDFKLDRSDFEHNQNINLLIASE